MAIEVTVTAAGQTNIPDQTQLRGCFIDSVTVLPSNVAAKSAVTGSSSIATTADLEKMTLTLMRASDMVMQNMPMLMLNPFSDGGTTPNQFLRELFLTQYIDWNQSFLYLNAAPSSSPIIVSLGVYYYNPNLDIETDNMKLVTQNNKNLLVNWINAAMSGMGGTRKLKM